MLNGVFIKVWIFVLLLRVARTGVGYSRGEG